MEIFDRLPSALKKKSLYSIFLSKHMHHDGANLEGTNEKEENLCLQ